MLMHAALSGWSSSPSSVVSSAGVRWIHFKFPVQCHACVCACALMFPSATGCRGRRARAEREMLAGGVKQQMVKP